MGRTYKFHTHTHGREAGLKPLTLEVRGRRFNHYTIEKYIVSVFVCCGVFWKVLGVHQTLKFCNHILKGTTYDDVIVEKSY